MQEAVYKREREDEGGIGKRVGGSIYVRTDVQEKWIRVLVAISAAWETIAEIPLLSQAVVNNAIGKEEEIGSEGKSPGAGYC